MSAQECGFGVRHHRGSRHRINRSITLPKFTEVRECIVIWRVQQTRPYVRPIMAENLPHLFAYAEVVNTINICVLRFAS